MAFSVVVTVALGIGANAAIFSAVNAVFFKPLPFADEKDLYRIYVTPVGEDLRLSPRPEVFELFRDHSHSFEQVVAQRFMDMTLTTPEGPERVTGIGVTAGWAQALGVSTSHGRSFSPAEESHGTGSGVTLISYRVWQNRFGADPGALGQTVVLDQQTFTVVGVLPQGFNYPQHADFWVPMDLVGPAASIWGLNIQARLKRGVSIENAREEMAALSQRLPEVTGRADMAFLAVGIREVLLEDDSQVLVALLAAGGFLMLIVCSNVANLLLAQSISRRQEHALRSAMGAGFGHHLRLALTESALLAALGAGLGYVLAAATASLLTVLIPGDLTFVVQDLAVEWPAILLAAALAAIVAVTVAVAPARRATRHDPAPELLRGGVRTTGNRGMGRISQSLVAAEIAVVLILMAGASVVARDLWQRTTVDMGYEPEGLLTMNLSLAHERYAEGESRMQMLGQSLDAIRALPGVRVAGVSNIFPSPEQGNLLARVAFDGEDVREDNPHLLNYRLVSPGFVEALGLRLLGGRSISSEDRDGSLQVAVINSAAAARYFPGTDPIGRRIQVGRDQDSEWLTVVGVVSDNIEFYDVDETVFVAYAQNSSSRHASQVVFAIRCTDPSEAQVAALRSAIWSVDSQLAIFDVATAADLYADALAGAESASLLTVLFAFIGLAVALVGVYASMAFSVGQRRREIAVRMALGAVRSRVLGVLLGGVAQTVAWGMGSGLVGAAILSRWLVSLLPGLDPALSGLLVAVSLALALASFLAALEPALRATRASLADVLRSA